jgi:CBS domain containing-hemolysin-like protein
MWVLLDRERRLEENLAPAPFDLRRVLREVLIVPETKPASELLVELRNHRVGMALVVDEFGSILGLVTLEDILEQVVGEIHDEFDVVERPQKLADGAVVFDAALNVRDLDGQYNIILPEDPAYATVGGFVLDQLGFIPRGGEKFEYGGYRFTVVEMDGRRVARVKIERVMPIQTESKSASGSGSASGSASSAAANDSESTGASSSATDSASTTTQPLPADARKPHPDRAARTR